MHFPFRISLPFTDPVLIFSLVLFIILLAPLILRKFRIPGIVGLIIAGVIIGPHGFNLLLRDSSIILFGTVGLLYIMFQVGLDLDLNEFLKKKHRSFIFGIATFIFPFAIGFFTCYYLLDYSMLATVLIASMFSTHTLVAYPVVSRLGIVRNEAVALAVGGTIITDTIVLIIFGFITGLKEGLTDSNFYLRWFISLALFGFAVLWGVPRIGRWFFRKVESEKTSQYIFVLALVFLSAFFAKVAGVDSILGAFIAGLALNRLIPRTSPLMNRIEFVGNALFIPFFLISVGMLVDLRVLLKGETALIITAVLTSGALLGKYLAALLTQVALRLSAVQRDILFGLSSSHAAVTIVIILTGFNLGIVDENVLNATVVIILVTCLVASFVTDRAGRKLALAESESPQEQTSVPEKILVPITDPASIEKLMDLAIMMKDAKSTAPIYPLAVVEDDEEAREKITVSKKMLERAAMHASATDSNVHIITRVDLNFASGVLRTIKELSVTDVVLNWDENIKPAETIFNTSWIFGTALDNLLHNSRQMIIIARLIQPVNTFRRIAVVTPPNCEAEPGFYMWMVRIKRLARQTGLPVLFYSDYKSAEVFKKLPDEIMVSGNVDYKYFRQWDDFQILKSETDINDLLIVITARKGRVSYTGALDGVPSKLQKNFQSYSFMLVYPEQGAAA
ncbi:MAG: cation:proton antiporter [Bacteroidetes bacterium]|nr:cation:proton antiporter [Bacteroidota bacterium]